MQREITVKGAKIIVHESGRGTPILYLHGSPDTGEMWSPLIKQVGDQFRHLAMDIPGFGGSTMPDDFSLTLDNMADFICESLGALQVTEPVILVMADFGAHYGLAFAVKYPDKVRGMAITNTNFFRDYQWHSFAKLYRVPLMGEILMASSSKKMISNTLKNFAPALPADYVEQSYATGFGSPKTRKAILRMYRSRSSSDFAGWDDKLLALMKQKPAIVLWGDRDPFITPTFADRFVGAQVHHFADYSHWLPLETPEKYADKLKTWLAGI